jgi:hypothetical protein
MSPDLVLTDGFRQWLLARPKGPPAPLDPWGTSLRNTHLAVSWMAAIRAGEDIPRPTDRSRDQAVSDLRTLASLVSGNRSTHDVALTAVGQSLLSVWEAEGLTGDSEGAEVARCIHLIRQVFLHETTQATDLGGEDSDAAWYRAVYQRWLRLRRLQPAEYWWRSVEHAQLPCYLDWTDPDGYNPWVTLVEATGGDIGDLSEWRAWASSDTPGAEALADLLRRIRGNHRAGGSKAFRQALECIYLAEFDPASLPETLTRWDVPA